MTSKAGLRAISRRAGWLLVFAMAYIACAEPRAAAQTPPQELTRSQVTEYNSDSESVDGPFPGLLVIPRARPNYRDEKYQKPYRLACHVYAAVPGSKESEQAYSRRFLVCAADADALPLVKQVARLLLLLYGERHSRLRDDHPEDLPTVNVWLTERVEPGLSPDTGGEQFQNQIYLYDIHRERAPIEWAREIAHEYGHYGLPGISGFKSPEEWANGVLGERLFLKWIRDDVRAGRLEGGDVPFATPALLDEYYSRSIWPHIARIIRRGVDPALFKSTGAAGMDHYTGLALYVDTLYGSALLLAALQDTTSHSKLTFAKAPDFLRGVEKALGEQRSITLALPTLAGAPGERDVLVYLPGGTWDVGARGLVSWRVAADAAPGVACSGKSLQVRTAGWHRLTYLPATGSEGPARLLMRKHG